MRFWRMRTGISITLKPADRRRLKALARDRNTPHKHVWRAEIVLLSADGIGTNEIMRRTGKSKTCVWRWQERFMQAGYDSLLRDKTRPSRIPPLGSHIAEHVVMLTQTDPPAEATHWTAIMMAKAVGISASSVQRIWRAHGLQPHRVKQFKLSTDPEFVGKLRAIVGLYVDPPAHAVVLSVDEKRSHGVKFCQSECVATTYFGGHRCQLQIAHLKHRPLSEWILERFSYLWN